MRLLIIIMLIIVATGCSCGRSDDSRAQAANDSVVKVSVKQARKDAIAAAEAIALSDHNDTLDMQRAIVDAYATRSHMLINGNEKAAKEFDKTLKEELQRLDPELANEVFKENN